MTNKKGNGESKCKRFPAKGAKVCAEVAEEDWIQVA
jgi:hypothetical protein